MNKQFTAEEVHRLSNRIARNNDEIADAQEALRAFANMLEAQEKAVPVAWMERVVAYGIAGNILTTESTPHAFPVYAHPPAASVTSANADMYWLDSDPEHLSFEDIPSALEYVEGDDITTVTLQRARKLSDITVPVRFNNECGNYEIDEAALAAHSAQAQAPAASAPVDAVMRVIDGQRRLPYRSIDEKQAFRNELEAALAAQENPNGV